MRKKPNPEMVDDANPEWTEEDFRRARPAREVLPPELFALLTKRLPGQRGAQKAPVKRQVTLRLDENIVAHFKAGGRGWQTRINAALKRIVAKPKGKAA
jgi:uncharacterized protein (DUF4415 family)